jgi:hypothetical protein
MKPTLAFAILVLSCSRETGTTPTNAASSSVRPDEYGMPELVRVDIVERVCKTASCSGDLASIEVWRTEHGKIGRYAHHGDIQSCSHPPTTVFDATGKELGAIANQPVLKGSEEERRFAEQRATLFGAHRKSETVDCQARVRR